MKCNNLGGCRTIDEYVKIKLAALNKTDREFSDFFEFMFSEKEAVLYERSFGYKIVKTTYGEAYESALTRGAALRERLGYAPHDSVIGVYMENGVEWIETFWAVLAAGFCPFLLNLRLDTEVLERSLSDISAIAVIADHGDFSIPTIRPDELVSDKHASCEFGTKIFVMSTGTTSNVKICSYGAKEFSCLVSDSAYIVRVCSQIKRHYNGEIKLLTFLPFYHVFGLIAMYIWFAFFARSFVHLSDMEPQTILNTIRRHEVTHIFAVPLFWERIYDQAMRTIASRGAATLKKYQKGVAIGKKLEGTPALARAFRRAAFSEVRENLFGDSVQFMITGGSPIRKEALEFFNDIGYHLTNGYGMTEIGITSVELSASPRKRNTATVGAPLPSISYKISDEGELLVRGESLASSIRQGDRIAYRSEEDWFATGDLAECRDGSYYILGRKDDVILLPNGEMLNPNLIEPQFIDGQIAEACLADADVPTLLLAVDKKLNGEAIEALRARITDKLKSAKLDTDIRAVVFVRGSLLGANDFKLNRAAIARRYKAGELPVVGREEAKAVFAALELELRVAGIFATVLSCDVRDIVIDADFFNELDGSSLDYFALLSALKETFGLAFVDDGKADFHTVSGVCRYIEGEGRNAD